MRGPPDRATGTVYMPLWVALPSPNLTSVHTAYNSTKLLLDLRLVLPGLVPTSFLVPSDAIFALVHASQFHSLSPK